MSSAPRPDTSQLIARLSSQTAPAPAAAYLTPVLLSGVMMLILCLFIGIIARELGLRPDLPTALLHLDYANKLALAALTAVGATWAMWQSARPTASVAKLAWMAPLAVALASFAQAIAQPAPTPNDQSGWVCLTVVIGLSLPALALAICYLRQMAPLKPTWAGFWAGLACSGLAATAYALHCPNDTAGYVVMWYMPALLLPAVIGSVAGRYLLRW